MYAVDPAGAGGVTRTLSNTFTYATTPSTIIFGDTGSSAQAQQNNSNSLVFAGSGPATFGATAIGGGASGAAVTGARLVTLQINSTQALATPNPLLSASAVRFPGPVGLRAATDAAAAAAGVAFNNTVSANHGRIEFAGVVSNGGTGAAGSAGIVVGGGTAGLVAVRLSNPANTYTGVTYLQSGSLIVAADAPATGAGALGTPAAGNEVVPVGTTTGTLNRYLVLDVTGGPVTLSRPLLVRNDLASSPTTILGSTVAPAGATPNTGTFGGVISLGTPGGANPLPLILNANTQSAAASAVQFTGILQRSGGFTGDVNVLVNATLGGFGGSGTVRLAAATAGLNAATTLFGGTLAVPAGVTYQTGRGVTVSGGTLLVDGGLPAGTGGLTAGGGLVAGTGTIGLATAVNPGGAIRGDSGGGTLPLTVAAPLTVTGAAAAGGQFTVQLSVTGGAITAASYVALSGPSDLNVVTSAGPIRVVLGGDAGLTPSQPYTVTLATVGAGQGIFQNGGPANFQPSDVSLSGGSGTGYTVDGLAVVGTSLQITFTPVPEPAAGLVVAGLGVRLAVVRRRKTARQIAVAKV